MNINRNLVLLLIFFSVFTNIAVFATPYANMTENSGQTTPPMTIFSSSGKIIFQIQNGVVFNVYGHIVGIANYSGTFCTANQTTTCGISSITINGISGNKFTIDNMTFNGNSAVAQTFAATGPITESDVGATHTYACGTCQTVANANVTENGGASTDIPYFASSTNLKNTGTLWDTVNNAIKPTADKGANLGLNSTRWDHLDAVYDNSTTESVNTLQTSTGSTMTVATGTTLIKPQTTKNTNLGTTSLLWNDFYALLVNGTTVDANTISPSTGTLITDTATTNALQGTISKYNNISTGGIGVPAIYNATKEKSETGADVNLVTYTPPASTGSYRISVNFCVSAASSATLGWTATWTDSNTHAQAPTNMQMFTVGASTTSTTVSAAANSCYYSSVPIDVSSGAVKIIVKTTFSGTSIAYKATGIIEQLQ